MTSFNRRHWEETENLPGVHHVIVPPPNLEQITSNFNPFEYCDKWVSKNCPDKFDVPHYPPMYIFYPKPDEEQSYIEKHPEPFYEAMSAFRSKYDPTNLQMWNWMAYEYSKDERGLKNFMNRVSFLRKYKSVDRVLPKKHWLFCLFERLLYFTNLSSGSFKRHTIRGMIEILKEFESKLDDKEAERYMYTLNIAEWCIDEVEYLATQHGFWSARHENIQVPPERPDFHYDLNPNLKY
jgi:hypothetical protein